jgi:hypothetical protein
MSANRLPHRSQGKFRTPSQETRIKKMNNGNGNQCCGSGFTESGSRISSESGSGYGPTVFMTKNWKKIKLTIFLISFFDQKFQLLILRPPWRTTKLQKKSSALKRWNLLLCYRPASFYAHPYFLVRRQSRSESVSGFTWNPDSVNPDPQHWF